MQIVQDYLLELDAILAVVSWWNAFNGWPLFTIGSFLVPSLSKL